MRENEGVEAQERPNYFPHSKQYSQRIARKLQDWADYCANGAGGIDKNLIKIFEYMKQRNLYMDDTDYYWTPTCLSDRLIIPSHYEKRIVGWTARTV